MAQPASHHPVVRGRAQRAHRRPVPVQRVAHGVGLRAGARAARRRRAGASQRIGVRRQSSSAPCPQQHMTWAQPPGARCGRRAGGDRAHRVRLRPVAVAEGELAVRRDDVRGDADDAVEALAGDRLIPRALTPLHVVDALSARRRGQAQRARVDVGPHRAAARARGEQRVDPRAGPEVEQASAPDRHGQPAGDVGGRGVAVDVVAPLAPAAQVADDEHVAMAADRHPRAPAARASLQYARLAPATQASPAPGPGSPRGRRARRRRRTGRAASRRPPGPRLRMAAGTASGREKEPRTGGRSCACS